MSTVLSRIGLVVALVGAGCSGGHGNNTENTPATGTGTPGAATGTLTIKGSDTMVILAQRWAERFMSKNAGTTVQVSGGGSGTGITALINGTTDIATASRRIKDQETASLQTQRHAAPHEVRVAIDAIAVYVNTANPVQQ